MINTNLLKGRIMAQGMTQTSLAKAIGKSKNTINAKINGKLGFTLSEVDAICRVLCIDDPDEKCAIFLPRISQ